LPSQLAVPQRLRKNHPNALGFSTRQRVHVIRNHHGANTMSTRFKKAVIDDVVTQGIDSSLQDHLLDLFESAMKSVATTLVREAKFDTSDFATAKLRGCEGFILLVGRARADSRDSWYGAFQRGDERLDVVGHLE
jgi:ABC-type phosphonate transport system ATPase subunit